MSSCETNIEEKEERSDRNQDEKKNNALKAIGNFVSRQFFPLGSVFVILFGIFVPQPSVYFAKKLPIIKICIVAIFLMFGLRFRLAEVKSAIRSYREMAFGFVFVLFVTPLIGTNIVKQVPEFGKLLGTDHESNLTENNSGDLSVRQLPMFGPEEFRIGLQIFCISPCSSAFSTLMVSQANGNKAVSLLVSVICIIISVFTVPALVVWLIPAVQTGTVDFWAVLINVILLIPLPLIFGRGLRFVSIVKKITIRLEKPLKFASSCAILAIFLVKISETSANGNFEMFSPWSIMAVTALGTGIICVYLVISFSILSLLPFPKKSTIALAVLSCARNMAMTTTIIDSLPDSVGDKGLMIFPVALVYLVAILVLNIFVSFVKIEEVEEEDDEVITYTNETAIMVDDSALECDGVKGSIHSTVNTMPKFINTEFYKIMVTPQNDGDVNPTIAKKKTSADSFSSTKRLYNTQDFQPPSQNNDFVRLDIQYL